jgi:hypothetical protein
MREKISNRPLSQAIRNRNGFDPKRMLFYDAPDSRIARRIREGKTNQKKVELKK